MELNKISLGSLFHKNEISKQKEDKKQTSPIHLPVADSHVSKKANSAAMAYAAALLALGGGAMTSCVETDSHSESIVNVDLTEFKEMFQKLLDMQNLILQQLQQNTSDNKEMIKILKEQNKVLQDIYTGVIDIKEGVNKLYDLAVKGQEFDKEYLAKLDKIIANQDRDSDKISDILSESQKQTAWMANIGPYIEQIKEISAVTGDTLQKFYEAFLEGEVGHSEFNEKLLNAVLNNGNISKEILEEIKGFRADCEAGRITEAELLAKIIEKLASIDDKMSVVIEKLNTINSSIVSLGDKMDANHINYNDKLDEINQSIKDGNEITNNQFNEANKNIQEGNKINLEILNKMDALKDVMIEIRDKDGNIKIEELLTKYGDIMGSSFQEVLNMLQQGQDKDIKNTQDIIDAIKDSKFDSSKIQEQMGTIIVLLQNAQSAGITPEDLQKVTDAIDKLTNSNTSDNAQINANLAEVLKELAEIKGMLGVIAETLGDVVKNQVKYGNATEVAFENVANGMQQMLDKQLTKEQMDELMAKYHQTNNQYESYFQQTVTLLQAILENQGKGSSGMTPEELDNVINNNETFNELKKMLGDLNIDRVTNTTLNETMIKNKADLSKLQEQMGTVIVLLQHQQSGDIIVDTSKLETAISDLVSAVNNQGVTSNTAMKDLSDKLQSLIDMLKPEEPTNPESRTVRMPQSKNYQASVAQFQKAYDDLLAQQKQEMDEDDFNQRLTEWSV